MRQEMRWMRGERPMKIDWTPANASWTAPVWPTATLTGKSTWTDKPSKAYVTNGPTIKMGHRRR